MVPQSAYGDRNAAIQEPATDTMTRHTRTHQGNASPAPADQTVYPGWWIVLAAGSGQMLQGGFVFWSMGLYTAAFEDVFGAPRAQINLIETCLTVSTNLLSPIAGILIDRWSVRHLMMIGLTAMGLGLIVLSQAGHPAPCLGSLGKPHSFGGALDWCHPGRSSNQSLVHSPSRASPWARRDRQLHRRLSHAAADDLDVS